MESLSKQQTLSRKFSCDFLGCGKSFTRAEHLQRHKLNHRESVNTCKRCLAHFSRLDLLERHIERHAQKDKEAGGEGLGVLVTRKRCWRDENGNITTKRPASSLAAIEKALEARRQKRGDSSDESGSSNGGDNTGGQISPPYLSTPPSPTPQDGPNIRNGPGMHGGLEIQLLQDVPSCGFLAAAAPVPQPKYRLSPPAQGVATPVSLQANFDDHSRADAIQSSEMPSTMLNTCNCHWLLGELRMLENSHGNIGTSFDQNSVISRNQAGTNMAVKPAYDNDNGVLSLSVNGHEFLHFEGKPSSQQQDQQFVQQNLHGPKQQLDQGPTEIDFEQQTYYLTGSINHISPAPGNPNGDTIDVGKSSHFESFLSHQHTHNTASQTRCPHVSHPYGSHCVLPVSPESQHSFPEINQVSRQQVLELIVRASSPMTSGPHFSWDDPLLSLSALQNYSDLFFSRFNSTYPLIHRQSFDPSSVNTLLLASMLTLGAACGGKDAHKMAVRIHDILQGILANSDYFHATPELWVLQTLLLIEVFGRSRAGMGQHDMARLFHGLLIDI